MCIRDRLKGAVTKETAVKPEYVGEGCLVLEPTYKYIILADIGKWGSAGMTIEDGMFLACDANVKSKVVARKNLSSAVLGLSLIHIYNPLVPVYQMDLQPPVQSSSQLTPVSYTHLCCTYICDDLKTCRFKFFVHFCLLSCYYFYSDFTSLHPHLLPADSSPEPNSSCQSS